MEAFDIMNTVSPELQSIMARIKAQVEEPAYQERVAREELARLEGEHRDREAEYNRRIERLSRLHIGFVREHCDDLEPREPIPVIWRKLMTEWDWQQSVFLVGETETQKTTAATWASMRLARDGRTVAHTTALRIATAHAETLREWQEVSALTIDELHRLKGAPEWKVGPVWDLIDARYQSKGITFVLGTVDPKAMETLAGAEVLRRIPLKLTATVEQLEIGGSVK